MEQDSYPEFPSRKQKKWGCGLVLELQKWGCEELPSLTQCEFINGRGVIQSKEVCTRKGFYKILN